MFKINIEKYKLESYFLGILYLGIICGNVVIVIALFNSKIQDPLYSTYSVILQVYTPFTVSIGPILYRYIFKRSHLILDLESSREYLIRVFEIEVSNPAEYYNGKPMAKYLRINLKNIGNKTARNCRIKMYVYYNNFQLIHEPSNIYCSCSFVFDCNDACYVRNAYVWSLDQRSVEWCGMRDRVI